MTSRTQQVHHSGAGLETATGSITIGIRGSFLKSVLTVLAKQGTSPTLDVKVEELDPVELVVIGAAILTHTQVTSVTALPFTEEKDFVDSATRIASTVLLVTWTIGGTATPGWRFTMTVTDKD